MKGIIFTEFMRFVAKAHGEDFVDDMLHECGKSDRAYTSVGTYDFSELASILGTYCTMTGVPAPEALRAFGQHLAETFRTKFDFFYNQYKCLTEFLEKVDDNIHIEVCKLYPDAQVPRFTVAHRNGSNLTLRYGSCRPLAHLAIGLIEGSATHFSQRAIVGATPCSVNPAEWLITVELAPSS